MPNKSLVICEAIQSEQERLEEKIEERNAFTVETLTKAGLDLEKRIEKLEDIVLKNECVKIED